MARSTLIIGVVYDCGRCEKMHVSCAGGVVVSDDGLVLTNYHVVEQKRKGTEGMVAVSHDGLGFPIVEVLSASKSDDVALIRLGGDVGKLRPANIAKNQPAQMTPVNVLSHPHRHYFVLTEGKVSRFVYDSRRSRSDTVWMEITAEFGAGSSGADIFNDQGQVVGLVSTIVPLVRRAGQRQITKEQDVAPGTGRKGDLLELLLHRCVPLKAIQKRFRG